MIIGIVDYVFVEGCEMWEFCCLRWGYYFKLVFIAIGFMISLFLMYFRVVGYYELSKFGLLSFSVCIFLVVALNTLIL